MDMSKWRSNREPCLRASHLCDVFQRVQSRQEPRTGRARWRGEVALISCLPGFHGKGMGTVVAFYIYGSHSRKVETAAIYIEELNIKK